jgi:hypothetical protein
LPKFDAKSFEDVEYDFTGIRSAIDGEYIQDKGVVPEPSRQLVSATMKAISKAYNELNPPDKDKGEEEVGSTPDEIAEAMEKLDDNESFEKMADALVGIISDLCQGHPTPESLNALPWNRFMGFFGYIMENLLSPEASAPGTNDTPARLRSV